MIVVSDTTPLSELAKVNQLTLLREIYGRVVIPRQVYEEVLAGTHPAVTTVPLQNWIEVVPVKKPQNVLNIQVVTKLGLGECAALVLAEELGANLLLIDDLEARREALRRNLVITGTVGTLIIAKQRGLISSVKVVLDNLTANGTWISRAVYQNALTAAGEWKNF